MPTAALRNRKTAGTEFSSSLPPNKHPEQPLPPCEAAPFLKWAGGKGQLLPQLSKFFPNSFSRYFEPFLGSAAVFFYLRRQFGGFPAVLSDSNADLINCYAVIRDDVSAMFSSLRRHQSRHDEKYYYLIRDRKDPRELPSHERAVRFIYLNKTCYNGLYRVNRSGKFNVPVGDYAKAKIFHEGNLTAVSRALRGVQLTSAHFEHVLDSARQNDFVYFDPPYYTAGSGFTGYAVSPSGHASFGADDHKQLSEVARSLVKRGCHVVVSNSDTDFIRRIYLGFEIHTVMARRFINCNGNGRAPVNELVITSR